MTVSQLRLFLSNKPKGMSWEEFNELEVGVFNDKGFEFISEFFAGCGVIDKMCDCGMCDGIHPIFFLMSEEMEDIQDEYEEPTAQEELAEIGRYNIETNLN